MLMYSGPRVSEAVDRLKGVFDEVPGTRVTLAEAVLLSGLDTGTCSIVLETLTDAGFLSVKRGVFIRRSDLHNV
jgi:hypothetical protein